jgi:hypothetical protein
VYPFTFLDFGSRDHSPRLSIEQVQVAFARVGIYRGHPDMIALDVDSLNVVQPSNKRLHFDPRHVLEFLIMRDGKTGQQGGKPEQGKNALHEPPPGTNLHGVA